MSHPEMSVKQFIELFRGEFFLRLAQKTGWGKEELKAEFERALVETFANLHTRGGESA